MSSGKYPHQGSTSTENIDLKSYFSEYSQLVQSESSTDGDSDKDIFSIIGVELTKAAKENLITTCSPDILTVEEEIAQELIGENIKLTTDCRLNFDIPRCARNLKILQSKEKWKTKLGRVQDYPIPLDFKTEPLDLDLTPFEDVVIVVKVYNPFKYSLDSNYFRKDRISYSHEIVLLASHTLADLRDKIVCSADMGYTIELRAPIETTTPAVKKEYPSGFIFIEGCFYNDMRFSNCIDYSEVILNWAKDKSIAEFTAADMCTTKVGDLVLKLGYPYLYQHQGDCEHIIMFSDVRLLKHSESLCSNTYPYYQSERRYASVTCFICCSRTSRYMVSECDRLPHKYSYFCKECLLSYNYKDGKKIGSFKLYPYHDKASILLNPVDTCSDDE